MTLDFSFTLPIDFLDFEWEVQSKGHFSEARLSFSGRTYRLNFYDAVRLRQEIESEFERDSVFFEPNLIVIKSVTKLEMQRAVENLVKSKRVFLLTSD